MLVSGRADGVCTVCPLLDDLELSHQLVEAIRGRIRAQGVAVRLPAHRYAVAHCGQSLRFWLPRATSRKQSSSQQRWPPPCALQ